MLSQVLPPTHQALPEEAWLPFLPHPVALSLFAGHIKHSPNSGPLPYCSLPQDNSSRKVHGSNSHSIQQSAPVKGPAQRGPPFPSLLNMASGLFILFNAPDNHIKEACVVCPRGPYFPLSTRADFCLAYCNFPGM